MRKLHEHDGAAARPGERQREGDRRGARAPVLDPDLVQRAFIEGEGRGLSQTWAAAGRHRPFPLDALEMRSRPRERGLARQHLSAPKTPRTIPGSD